MHSFPLITHPANRNFAILMAGISLCVLFSTLLPAIKLPLTALLVVLAGLLWTGLFDAFGSKDRAISLTADDALRLGAYLVATDTLGEVLAEMNGQTICYCDMERVRYVAQTALLERLGRAFQGDGILHKVKSK